MSTPAGDDGLVGNATIRVDGDTDPATRALARFSRDAQGRLRDVRGRFVSETQLINRTVTNNTPTLTINTGPATNALNTFTRDVNGRLRDVNGRFVRAGDDINNTLTRAAGGGSRFTVSLRSLAGAAGTAAGILGRVGLGIGAIGAAAGTAAPLLAGIVTTLENIAPAGAVAVTGMLAVTQASAAIKLGMVGVEDAVTAAFATGKGSAEEFDKALKNLSPSARAFAEQVRAMAPGLREFQQSIQERLFTGLDDVLKRVASSTMPTLRSNLKTTATTLRTMAVEAAGSASALAEDGTLGKAMKGANQGLLNLATVPARVVTALGQLAAAGAPAFDRFTGAITRTVDRISEKISTAFQSGKLTSEVNTAADVLADLGQVGSNVFAILGNIMAPVQAAGGGLVGTLKEITGVLRDATATQGFQDAISAVSQTMATLARTAGPLLGQALAAIGPILTTLAGPAQTLIQSLGAGLSPIIGALGPVLQSAAAAVGVLVEAAAPLLPVIGQLVASLLPALLPILDAVQTVFAALAPVVQTVSKTLQSTLEPVLAQLPGIIAPLADMLAGQLVMGIQLLGDLLVQLAPSFVSLGTSVGQLLTAAAPLVTIMAGLTAQFQGALLPAIQPIINLVATLAAALAGQLASTLTNLVVPALQLITNLLRGDFSAAWNSLKALVSGVIAHFTGTFSRIGSIVGSIVQGVVDRFKWLYNILIGNSIVPDLVNGIIRWFTRLPSMAFAALKSLVSGLVRIATSALNGFRSAIVSGANAAVSFARGIPGRIRAALNALGGFLSAVARAALSRFRSAISSGAASAVSFVRGVPGRIKGALGATGSLLYSAGRAIIQGMINGVKAMAGSLVSAAKGVVQSAVDGAKNILGISSPSKVFAAIGRDTGRGFIVGLTGTREKIRQTTESIAAAITKAFRGKTTGIDDRLVTMLELGNVRLQRLASQRDKIADRLKKAQEFASQTTQSALSFASLGGGLGGAGPTTQSIQADLKKRLNQIRSFTANIKKLSALGLRKDLLQQIIQMGPEQGAAYASALSQGGKAGIKEINALQKQIGTAATSLGRIGADRLFDSGKNAGKGFLEGLKGQQKSIERLMLNIAKSMQKAIRRALGIKSPSTVMAQVGRQTVLGLQGGIARTAPLVDQAMARVANAVATAVPTTLPFTADRMRVPDLGVNATRTATTGAPITVTNHYYLRNEGVIGSQIELDNWLTKTLDRLGQQRRLPASLRRAIA